MRLSNPFNVDAALASAHEIALLPPKGGAAIRAFCGVGDSGKDWTERGVCVLKARKGFGKSHLLISRSERHRASPAAARTIFYPQEGHHRKSCDTLSSLHVVVPRWLHGRESVAAWVHVWQISMLGLLVWIVGARSGSLHGYSEWFGSLELLDQIQLENRTDSQIGTQPAAALTWFIGRVLEHLPQDDYVLGTEKLKQCLYHASSDWAIAITSSLARYGKKQIAMYLDAPDELVELDPPNLWRNVQQGLLLAIWKFSKSTVWGPVLNIYASVRSEAFGSGQDHADIALAMGLVMPLRYQRDDLEAMLEDRIRLADAPWLQRALQDGVKPVHALCGFNDVKHDNRATLEGGRYIEDVFDSILRHTRRVPREVIGIGGAIFANEESRNFEIVRDAVNAQASLNISYAIKHSFLGWSDALHRHFAIMLRGEVIDRKSMERLAAAFGSEGPHIVKFLVQHGLLGVAEPLPKRHRHFYRQRFAYDEVHGNEEANSLNRDYFFLHPAFKEWIESQPERLNKKLKRLDKGVIGDQQSYEAMSPLLRLGCVGGRAILTFRTAGRMSTDAETGAASDPLRFLYVALYKCRDLKRKHINLAELLDAWYKLRSVGQLKDALTACLPDQVDALAVKIRDWAKKINRNQDIQQLQRMMLGKRCGSSTAVHKYRKNAKDLAPFISISACGEMGAQVEVSFPSLLLNELDWDESLYALLGS